TEGNLPHVNVNAGNGSIPRLRPRHRPRGDGTVNPDGWDPATRPHPGIRPGMVGPQRIVQVVERQALVVAHDHDVVHLPRTRPPQLSRVPELQRGGGLAGHRKYASPSIRTNEGPSPSSAIQ